MSDPQMPPLPPPKEAPAAPLVEVNGLNRVFGTVHAVRDLSFTIPRGGVVGFIGSNGAGKTTTMRIMATLDEATSGQVVIDGHDVVNHPRQVRQLVGWMPDAFGTYPNMNVWEYLDFFARSYGFGKAQRRDLVEGEGHEPVAPLGPRLVLPLPLAPVHSWAPSRPVCTSAPHIGHGAVSTSPTMNRNPHSPHSARGEGVSASGCSGGGVTIPGSGGADLTSLAAPQAGHA